jgi:glutamine synthetase
MAGLDGIENKIDATEQGFGPYDVDITELSEEERAKIGELPTSLQYALDALADDYDFLLKGEVFNEDLVKTWIAHKRKFDVLPLQLRPHPYEFTMYHDV